MLLAAVAMPRSVHAGTTDPATDPAGWQRLDVPGRAPARFCLLPDGVVTIDAERAVGFLLRPIAPGEVPSRAYRMVWRWRVLIAPPASDATAIGADDRPASLHLLFAGAGSGGGLGAVLRRGLRRSLLGSAFSGRALSYVWGGRAPAGTVMPNPHLAPDGILLVRRGPEAPLGVWFDEQVDPAADYRAAFGEAAPMPTHLALSADTDDLGGRAAVELLPPRFVAG
jgi:hypothetical protein